ncbi:MAG: tyrosine-type recombinase/integrase [Ramlibacter sp.]|nr:tyrosine-type recombinase/integrase [Ramlibacter sp.]
MKAKVTDFPHLLGEDPDVKKVLIANFQTGEFRADTPAEQKQLKELSSSVSRFHEAVAKSAAARGAMASMPVTRTGVMLDEATAEYFAERSGTLKRGTVTKHRTALNRYRSYHGNVDVGTLQDDKSAKAYKKSLFDEGLATTTIDDYIRILSAFFTYVHNNTEAKVNNPWTSRTVKGARNQTESYKPFDSRELKKIFGVPNYLRKMKLPDFYWGPLIAMHTGARAEEIASLTVQQVKREGGIDYLQILKGKTENAPRRIPLHDNLIELGFLEYVSLVRRAKLERVFPHLVDGKNGFKKNMTRQFSTYLRKTLKIQSALKVFHSFRHTVVTQLTDAGVNDGIKKTLVGHDVDTKKTAHDIYIDESKLTLASLKLAMNKVQLPANLTALAVDQVGLFEAAQRRLSLRKVALSKKPKPSGSK